MLFHLLKDLIRWQNTGVMMMAVTSYFVSEFDLVWVLFVCFPLAASKLTFIYSVLTTLEYTLNLPQYRLLYRDLLIFFLLSGFLKMSHLNLHSLLLKSYFSIL